MGNLWTPGIDGYEIHVRRVQFTSISTIGELWLGDWRECWTLEDCVRKIKIPKVTAIPAGRYEVIINFSNRFQRQLPLLLKVPNFDGVRIHPGNKDTDTEGCILVGSSRGVDFIGESRLAFNRLFDEMQRVINKGKVFIRITEDAPPLCEEHSNERR
jgi:hypothetical protein